jgi:hypothetical protein
MIESISPVMIPSSLLHSVGSNLSPFLIASTFAAVQNLRDLSYGSIIKELFLLNK